MSVMHQRQLSGQSVSTQRLMSARTLKKTLRLTKSESVWQLMHEQLRPEIYVNPTPRVMHTEPAQTYAQAASPDMNRYLSTTRQASFLPSVKDFERMLTRLTRLTSGLSLTLRPVSLSEDKQLDLRMEQGEWQYLRVKVLRRPTPLELSQRIHHGKVRLFSSRTVPEPTELTCDEVHTRDTVVLSDPGLKFKTEWVYFGVKCIDDAHVTISIRFGITARSVTQRKGVVVVDDLDDFRRDELKRESLNRQVEDIVRRRKAARDRSCHMKDFVTTNRLTAAQSRSHSPAKRSDGQHREEVLERKGQVYTAKLARAALSLRRQEMRLAEKQRLQSAALELRKRRSSEQNWLALTTLATATETLWQKLQHRKWAKEERERMVRAAVRIQVWCRRHRRGMHTKALAMQRALDSVTFYTEVFFDATRATVQQQLFALIRQSEANLRVGNSFSHFRSKSERYTVVQLQRRWRKFHQRKDLWKARVAAVWDQLLQPQYSLKRGKKPNRTQKDAPIPHLPVRSDSLLLSLWTHQRTLYAIALKSYKERKEVDDQPPSLSEYLRIPSREALGSLISALGLPAPLSTSG